MTNLNHKIAFVVATKDRPSELRQMLKSIEAQTFVPNQIVIVDGSASPEKDIDKEFPTLRVKYMHRTPPSASKQRNLGIGAVDPEMSLIGFLDDDIELKEGSVKAMMDFWERTPDQVAGAAFNIMNHPPVFASKLKSFPFVEKLGIYSEKKGIVLPSGFQTMIGHIPETIYVQWLPTGAVVWRRKIFIQFQLDEWFSGYSYLEDLDFSYRAGKKYQLAVVADAEYLHHSAPGGRGGDFVFGRREVTHRLYFVRKHKELSLFKCHAALLLRIFISLMMALKERKMGYLRRAWGNLIGLASKR